MTKLLNGKVAIVTGGTSGIGLASVEIFAQQGAKIVIADIQDDKGNVLAKRLGDCVKFKHADVSKEEEVAALVEEALNTFGKLDIMYNNAGVTGESGSMLELDSDGYDGAMAVNARSVMLGHKYAALQFKAQGTGGSIITTASVASFQGGWAPVAYTSSKHAVLGIVHQAAAEFAPLGIRSNAIAPGVIMTAIQSKAFGVPAENAEEYSKHLVEKLGPRQAMGRFGFPDDVAKTALFLASDLSGYINGAIIPVDGGASAITQNTFAEDITVVTTEYMTSLKNAG